MSSSESSATGDNNPAAAWWWIVELCGALAPIAAVVVFAAPIPTILKIRRDRTVGSLPLLPYTSMVANCFLWTTYGVLKRESKIYQANLAGFLLAVFYVAAFVPHAPKMSISSPTLPGSVKQHLQGCAAVVFATLCIAFLFDVASSIRTIGTLGIVFCLVMFASPLAALRTVLETQSAASIPLPFTAAATANCTFWTVWGWYKMDDFAIYFPNGLGLLFGLAQIALKLKYGSGPPGHQGDGKDLQMSDKLLPS